MPRREPGPSVNDKHLYGALRDNGASKFILKGLACAYDPEGAGLVNENATQWPP